MALTFGKVLDPIGLFSDPKQPKGFDFGQAAGIVNPSQQRQQAIVSGLSGQLAPVTADYTAAQKAIGQNYGTAANAAATAYNTGLNNLGTEDKQARDLAVKTAQQQAYRTLPQTQQSIKEALAATGRLRTGAAGTALAQPAIETAQKISDYQMQLEQQGLEKADARKEAGLNALYQTQQGVALAQAGIDQDTARTLLNNGRSDIITRAASLLGIEQTSVSQMLGLNTASQEQNILQSQQASQRQASMIRGIGSIGGGVIGGVYGGPAGAGIGSTIGGGLADIYNARS